MRILVADDSGRMAAGLGFLLAEEHEVRYATDGIGALQSSGAWPPDLVLAGGTLARMDGLALLAALRALGRVSATGVVLVGDGGDHHARARAHALGAVAYLSWPLDESELRRVLHRVDAALARASERPRAGTPRRHRRAG